MSKYNALNASLVADYFLLKGQLDNRPVSNKKLQKLLYYAQAWSLVVRKKKVFKEKIEAWVHGPAIREVYFKFKHFGFNPIQAEIKQVDLKKIPAEIRNFLDQVWGIYGHFDAQYLETLSHSELPWIEAREGLLAHEGSNNTISISTMKKYFASKLKEAQ